MHRIRHWLWIGKYRETLERDADYLENQGIQAILHLVANPRFIHINVKYVPVEDGEPMNPTSIKEGMDFVKAEHAAGKTILIACGAGISRSSTFTIAALKEIEGLSLLDAVRVVKAGHPDALPHPELLKSLCEYYEEDVFDELWELSRQ